MWRDMLCGGLGMEMGYVRVQIQEFVVRVEDRRSVESRNA